MEICRFQKNILLSKQTTFRIGGPADYFYKVKSEHDLIGALDLARQKKLPVFILGGGSNILVSDKGFRGLVIKIQISKSKFQIKSKAQMSKIMAGAGITLASLVQQSIDAGLTGLEWAIGIPGTLGGAIRGNAGAFGSDMAAIVDKVRILRDGKVREFSADDCQFGYRDSVFKKNKDIILSGVLKLKKGDLKKSRQLVQDYLNQRRQKQPSQPSAGSVFKNVMTYSRNRAMPCSYKKIPSEIINRGQISSGWLIEQAGLKGKQIGQAQISSKHANFIVNLGGAKAQDVIALITLAKEKVKEKFNIELKEEIQRVGF